MIILKEPTYTGGTVLFRGQPVKEVEYGYAIGFDEFNIILYKLSFSSVNGDMTTSPLGYYSSIKACLRSMMDKNILLTSQVASQMQEILNMQESFLTSVEKNVVKLFHESKYGKLDNTTKGISGD